MHPKFHALTVAFALMALASLSSSSIAGIVTFGSAENSFSMEFVTVGSPGNAADLTGIPNPAGSVEYTYDIGTYEVSRDMVVKANAIGGLGITLADMTGVGGNGPDKPATGLSWYEAARFVNWLNTSQGYHAAYLFDGSSGFDLWSSEDAWQEGGENRFRHKDSNYWLPSVDEWYKAAYFDPVAGSYSDFPTMSDIAPIAVSGGTLAGTAVYGQLRSTGPADVDNAGGLSAFGTMAQGGNVWEFEETEVDLTNNSRNSPHGVRGGSWADGVGQTSLSVYNRSGGGLQPNDERNDDIGFRVVSYQSTPATPEPSSLVLISIGLCAATCRQLRRRAPRADF